jgi:Zn-dependent alcohol dehydrogenase
MLSETPRGDEMTTEVRGVVARAKGAPVTIETVLVPDPGPGEAVVKTKPPGRSRPSART